MCGDALIQSPALSLSCSNPLLFEFDSSRENVGTYGYVSGQETIFSRCVTIASPPDDPDPDVPRNDQMEVVAVVTWKERGGERMITLRERLYNWR